MDPLLKSFKEVLKEDGIPLPFHAAKEYLGFMDGVCEGAEDLPDGAYLAALTDCTEKWLGEKRLRKIDAHGLVMSCLRARGNVD